MKFNFGQISALAAATSVTVAAVGMAPAHAASLTFNFSNLPPLAAPSLTFGPNGGISVTATARSTAGPGTASVYQGPDGLGVVGPNETIGTILGRPIIAQDDRQVDGFRNMEVLDLLFSQTVRIASVTFGRVGSGLLPGSPVSDDFTLQIGANVYSSDIPGGNLADSDVGTANLAALIPNLANRTSNLFSFSVLNAGDDYFVRGVTVETIPTPALLPGVVGFGLGVLRKRKAATAEKAEA